MRLAGRKAIVTAGASGIGRHGVEVFAAEGASVVAVDRDEARLAEVLEGVTARGGAATGIVADLSDPDRCRSVVEEAYRAIGGLDLLWCHAGMPGPVGIEEVDLPDFEAAIDLNLRASFIMTGAAAPLMISGGGGSILYTASVGGLRGSPTRPIYSAAKFGIVGFMMGAARKYGRQGIRVNALCPGPIDTPMQLEFMDSGKGEAQRDAAREATMERVPMGRLGRPEEVAHAAAWLASDEASYITGVALPIDGGYCAV